MHRRIDIKADDVGQLGRKVWIARALARADAMRSVHAARNISEPACGPAAIVHPPARLV
jgi:hypothetical protein